MKTPTNKNPFEDKKWLKEFAKEFKKDVKRTSKVKGSSSSWTREIICTQKDIGEPIHSSKKKGKK